MAQDFPPLTEVWAERIHEHLKFLVECDPVEPYADPRTGRRGHKFVLMDEGDGLHEETAGWLVVRVETRR